MTQLVDVKKSYPDSRLPRRFPCLYGRGGGVGRGLGVSAGLGVGEGLGVEVGVAVGLGVAVGVGVGVGPDCAQYFPPLLRKTTPPPYPPHTIISLPVQIAV
jgi:hypothetical protein